MAQDRSCGDPQVLRTAVAGEVDLIYVARKPTDDEVELMERENVVLDVRPVALDALVFVRSTDNPVRALTLANVHDIFAAGPSGVGKLSNWKEVGGPDEEIHTYFENRTPSSIETMKSLVTGDLPLVEEKPVFDEFGCGGPNYLRHDSSGIAILSSVFTITWLR